jgi:hypothetical protein
MLKNLLILIILALAFAGLFTAFKQDAGLKYEAEIATIPSVKMFGASPAVGENISKFGLAAGAALGLFAFIASAVIFGILRVVRVPSAAASGISNLLSYGGVAGLGYELVYLEEKNSALASAVVYYIGKPLFFAGIIAAALAIIFLIASFMKKEDLKTVGEKAPMILLLIFSSLFLSGCSLLGSVAEVGCNFAGGGKTAAHCYQEAAVEKNSEKVCDKAPQGEEFKQAGSNPPQDKCYYMVAENKRDPDVCDNIKGGWLSYMASECKANVLDSAEKEISEKLNKADGGKNLSPEELQKIQWQMEKYNKMNGIMTDITKDMHDMNMSAVRNLRN